MSDDDLRTMVLAFREVVTEQLDRIERKVDALRDETESKAQEAALAWANDQRDYRERTDRRFAALERRLSALEGRP